MQRKERLNHMVAAIVENGSLDVSTLASEFAVSPATIRRDLDVLEKQRLVSRTHGGASTHTAFNDVPLNYKTAQELPEKRRIARQALTYLDGARVIGMTGGTTAWDFSQLLLDKTALTIVTNAINIATNLVSNPGLRVFAAGGEVRSSSQETIGPSAESFLSSYNIDVAFIGVDGVSAADGCTNYDPIGARANSALIRRAKMSVVLADATKIERVALAQVCPMSAVDVLITDERAPQEAVDRIRHEGCRVICV
ncbi:DeoR/GlpR family DNA-binding transcription regulator [Spelaeicoccus albus]|uniref:DeoR family transcriptional regulator of aga operon n=1 Tax=Spelaeicoccus albus TaxID=1280376 RepID=A0A7Z0D096_9MICO|nr:DeoR/GlpR family DNA-binding transcription regulator [Spelaeicoccus albus]NYI67121.1 DeoR family transcriptional regulator of aga operon [Spelaeicoccus albus]